MTSWKEKLEGNEKLQAFRDHLSGKSERTQYTYLYHLKKICDFFSWDCSEFEPHQFTQEHYDEFFRQKSKVMKCTSINLYTNVVNVLSTIYGLGIKTKLLKEIDKFTDYLTFEELQEIINKADKEVAAVTTFIFCTGLRPVSVLSLKKDQLMLNAKHPYVKNVLLKGGRHQDIIIMYPDLTKPLLNWYLQYKSKTVKDYDKNEHVFVSQRGLTTDSYIYHLVRKCSAIVGEKCQSADVTKRVGYSHQGAGTTG